MTFDIDVQIFYGYKVSLSLCFDKGIVNSQIIDEDDWQLINMEEDLDTLIPKHILNSTLKKILDERLWKLYFVCPTQSNIDPGKSWMIIYYGQQTLARGSPQDYITGCVIPSPLYNTTQMTNEMCNLFGIDLNYSTHFSVECAW